MSKTVINGYTLTKELTNDNSGFAKWGFATKHKHEYFIKEFLSPIWPEANAPLSDAMRAKKEDECKEWIRTKAKVYNAITSAANGNIVVPLDFFRYGSHHYLVTDKIDTASVSMETIAALPEEKKLIIMKVFIHCLMQIGHSGVVHGDLKPNNLLIKETLPGIYTLKLIDFDASFLETELPSPNDIQCDTVYMAPEVFLYMMEEDVKVGTKSDIFSAGIIFHQYLCNALPVFPAEYDCIYEAVLDGAEPELNSSIPPHFASIIKKMLEPDYEKRVSAEEVYDLLTNIYNPAAEAKTTTATVSEPPKATATAQKAVGAFHMATDDDW